jgi:hypothetical protein
MQDADLKQTFSYVGLLFHCYSNPKSVDALIAGSAKPAHLIALAREFRTKRTMCGRAGFDLLRHRILKAA